jgi:hypothetical protein
MVGAFRVFGGPPRPVWAIDCVTLQVFVREHRMMIA